MKIYQEKFKDKKLKKLSDVDMLIQQVEGGKEPEDVLASYFQAE